MDCCVLSSEEVGQLRNYNILPNHENHIHIDSRAALDGVLDESYELIEGKNGKYHVTPSKLYFLRLVESGGIPVVQRVLSNSLKHLTPIRYVGE